MTSQEPQEERQAEADHRGEEGLPGGRVRCHATAGHRPRRPGNQTRAC